MKKDPNHNSTDPAENEAINTRLDRFLSGTGIDRTINKSTPADTVGEFGERYVTGSGSDLVDSEVAAYKAPGRYRSL